MNAFLKQFASQDQSQFLNATFLCFDESEMFEETNEQPKREIIGYYTLAQFSLHKAELEDVAIKTGKYAVVPAILLGWFGVNQAFQG